MSKTILRPLLIAFLVAGAFFMENLDGTVIATALPQMAASFGVQAVALNIGMTAYLLTIAVCIPVSGWMADRFGARKVFTAAIVTFTLASMFCGLVNGAGMFTAARVLQGLGGAMMVPVGRLVVLRTTEKRDLMRAINYITWPGLAAPVIGPPLGGFITQYFSWRWIFFLNIPLGVLGVFLALRLIPDARGGKHAPFDVIGFVLCGFACAGLLYSLDIAGRDRAPWREIAGLGSSASIAGVLAIWHMRRATHPLLDFSALAYKTFTVNVFGGSFFRIAIGATPFLLPLLFQTGFGLDPFHSGLLVLVVFAGNLSMKTATTPVIGRFGFKPVLVCNGILVALLIGACGLLTPATPTILVVIVLFLGGLSRSMQFSALTALGFADIPQERMSSANALSSMVFQLTAGFGIAVGAMSLRGSATFAGRADIGLSDFHNAFALMGLVALAGMLDCLGLKRDAGAEVSGRGLDGQATGRRAS